jgi:hypothetical protein
LWAILGSDNAIENSRRGQIKCASLIDAMKCLDDLLGQSGLMELVAIDPAETGPRGLQIRTEGGSSIITLAELDDKREKNIRTYRQGSGSENTAIHGSLWTPQMVCTDESLIRQIVTELLTSGNVSTELLS